MHKLTTTSLKQLTSAITTRALLNVVPQLQTRLIYDSRQFDDTGFDNTRNNSRSEFGDSFYRKPSYDRSFNNNTDRRPNMTNYNNNGGFSTYSHNSRGTENSYGRGMRDFALEDIDWDKASLQQVKKDFYVEHPNVAAATPESVALFRAEHNLKVTGKDIPNPIMTFEESGLPEPLIQQLKSAGFNKPTNIQSQGWPIALSGRDMIGLAETGSGKTLAFAAPAFVHIKAQAPLRYGDGPIALVLAPTRELAVQIQTECSKFSLSSGIKSMCAYGGSSKIPQMQQLRNGVHMCIATPGRLLDLLSTGAVNLKRVSYLVLDEADRMLDMGFEPQIRQIISQTRPDRQTLMWSATWPREVQSLASEFLTDPISIVVGSHELTVNNRVKQHFDFIENHQKFDQLTETLKLVFNESADGSAKALIFTNTKRTADEIAHVLQQNGHRASAIHGDKSQNQRDFTLRDFRAGRAKVMVATDVAARGLDVKDITAVINFDFPGTVEDYIHRIGRTARAGTHGKSYTYLSSVDMRNARSIVNILKQANQEIPQPLVDATRPVSNTNRNSSYGGQSRSRYGSNNRGGYGNDNYNRGGYGGGYDSRRGGYDSRSGGYDGGRDGFDRRSSSSRGSSEYDHSRFDLEREIRKGTNTQQRGFNFDSESDLRSSW